MICCLIGIVPLIENNALEKLLEETLTLDNCPIELRDSSIAIDEGTPTTLIEALTDATPERVIAAIETILNKEFDENQNRLSISFTCEIWATAPAPIPLRPMEGFDSILKYRTESCWFDWALLNVQKWGVMVQEKILDSNQLEQLSVLVTKAIGKTEAIIKANHPEINIGKDVFIFKEIASRNLERFDLKLTDYDSVNFVTQHILSHKNVNVLLQKQFGSLSEIDFDASVVYSRPGAIAQGWHADGSHQRGANDAGWEKDGWKTQLADAYAICLFLPLIDLNDEVGFTQFWPGSHRSSNFLGFGPVAEVTGSTFDGKCSAGDGVWYDYRLLHRGMPNNSNVVRPVLQVIFKKKWYIEKANYGDESIHTPILFNR